MARVGIQLLTWNGKKYIEPLVRSLKEQTFEDYDVIVLDNGSDDGTGDKVQAALRDHGLHYLFSQNPSNSGFAMGHNQLFRMHDAEYVFIVNQDLYLEPTCVGRLVEYLDTHHEVAVVAPRLMAWHFNAWETRGEFVADNIDSLGLRVLRNRRVIDWHQGELWTVVQQTLPQEDISVFGVSGACALFRRSVLEQIAYPGRELFDPSYHSYKEDVDLAYRIQSAGYAAATLVSAVAYHDRTTAGQEDSSDRATMMRKQTQAWTVRYHSYVNHLMTLAKNEYWQNMILDLPWILWYEGKKCVYMLLFDRSILKGLAMVWKRRNDWQKKRQHIMRLRKKNWKALRHWWTMYDVHISR
ncbi:MAG TPA: glycosyltransferase family 2 protein [Candidatus Kapabacteria bacterium]|nr:glycosyltransferase family 2 protein [Candidatus Kapabacteria bacterium]